MREVQIQEYARSKLALSPNAFEGNKLDTQSVLVGVVIFLAIMVPIWELVRQCLFQGRKPR